MKNAADFDRCRSARLLTEMLFDKGMLREALLVARQVDAAQLADWKKRPAPEKREAEVCAGY